MRGMKHGSTPGKDGLSCEFYQMFWKKIGPILWIAVNTSYKKGILYPSARKGVITLLPKKNKNPLYVDCWHPITLLSVDHKAITKMIANRKVSLSELIGPQQMAYLPGRNIVSNIRKLIDVLQYLEHENQPAILLTIDFKKCFDSVDQTAMVRAMEYFIYGLYIISWIKFVYNGF